jgi:protein SCO1/2
MKYAAIFAFLAFAAAARANVPDRDKPILPKYLQGVGIDQNLNAQVPLHAQFTDELGRVVTLGSYLGRRPAVLALVYYTCPMLCDQILRGVVHGLKPLSLEPGRDFEVIAISINPRETPPQAAVKRQQFVKLYSSKATPEGWHFLTGDEANIRAVADAVGYHYRYDPKSGMYFHAAGIMVLTPEGKAARYFYGVEFQPKDLKLGLVEASHNRIGSVVDQILLFCCSYDATTGKYTTTVLDIMRATAAVFFLALVGTLGFIWRWDIRKYGHPAGKARRT